MNLLPCFSRQGNPELAPGPTSKHLQMRIYALKELIRACEKRNMSPERYGAQCSSKVGPTETLPIDGWCSPGLTGVRGPHPLLRRFSPSTRPDLPRECGFESLYYVQIAIHITRSTTRIAVDELNTFGSLVVTKVTDNGRFSGYYSVNQRLRNLAQNTADASVLAPRSPWGPHARRRLRR